MLFLLLIWQIHQENPDTSHIFGVQTFRAPFKSISISKIKTPEPKNLAATNKKNLTAKQNMTFYRLHPRKLTAGT